MYSLAHEKTLAAPDIVLQHIGLRFNANIIFSNLNLTLKASRWTCLLGASGIGKTTLLHLIANLIDKSMTWQGKITCSNALPLSQQIAYLAQSDLLMPWLTAFENATISLNLRQHSALEKNKQRMNAHHLFEQMHLTQYKKYFPYQLSGGMRQRVALIRILLENKPVILMDEPFSSLDAMTRFKLQSLSAELLKNRTVLFITHDPLEALRLADDIYILRGKPADLSPVISLTTATPRDLNDTEVTQHYASLMRELMEQSP